MFPDCCDVYCSGNGLHYCLLLLSRGLCCIPCVAVAPEEIDSHIGGDCRLASRGRLFVGIY